MSAEANELTEDQIQLLNEIVLKCQILTNRIGPEKFQKFARELENNVKLIGTWCDCTDGGKFSDDPKFNPENGQCTCGIHKHHYHCKNCGRVIQIG